MSPAAISTTWGTVLAFIGSLGAVSVGWLLHEFSDFFKLRREDKRAVGRALAELLEVRARLQVMPTVMEEIRKKIPIAPHDEAVLRQVFDNFIPGVEEVQLRYNQAIDGMAGRLPLLAFRLRAKDAVTPLLRQLRPLVVNDSQAVAILGKVEDELLRLTLPQFDALALELASLHGWATWWRARAKLKEPPSMPKEFESLISYVIAEAQKAEAAKAQGSGKT